MSRQATRARDSKKQLTRKNRTPVQVHATGFDPMWKQRFRELVFVGGWAFAVFILLALISYSPADPAWSHARPHATIHNWTGPCGAYIADLLLYGWGYVAYLFPVWMGYMASAPCWERWFLRTTPVTVPEAPINWAHAVLQGAGGVLVLLSGAVLAVAGWGTRSCPLPAGPGGICGAILYSWGTQHFHLQGTLLWAISGALAGWTLVTGIAWQRIMARLPRHGKNVLFALWSVLGQGAQACLHALLRAGRVCGSGLRMGWPLSRGTAPEAALHTPVSSPEPIEPSIASKRPIPPVALSEIGEGEPARAVRAGGPNSRRTVAPSDLEPALVSSPAVSPPAKKNRKEAMDRLVLGANGIPDIALLDMPQERAPTTGHSAETLESLSRLVETQLANFQVVAEVVGVYPGPVITRFELQLAAGIKVSKIVGLAKDLARALSVLSVRVVEVIPGKPFVGLEVPNPNRIMVRLREVLETADYQEADSPLSLALGKDIGGAPVVVDLGRMPHVLVAGTTGSGKSVGINAMLLSLLLKATPESVRLILIDPKMLELSVYEGIPHLLAPVVTDMKDAAHALKWCVMEMERRYRLLSAMGVRNVAGFNRKIKEAIASGQPYPDPMVPPGTEPPVYLAPLPYIVVCIDEFADMIMVVGRKVEDLIARIAQKARAAGIHLILATQRPSVDVITGLIKANIPTRIAFQVSSRIDSRTILDQQGAEQLLGHGDMLYLPPGTGLPVRVHGAFVADQEVHTIVQAWRSQGEPQYEEAITTGRDPVGWGSGSGGEGSGWGDEQADVEQDPLYDAAVQLVIETRRGSASAIQRRFKVGYNRAARLVEQMEQAGIVSAAQHNGSREVLVPPSGQAEERRG